MHNICFHSKELCCFSCLQMTRHSSVRCVSDSSLQTVIFQNTRKSTGIRSLHVKSATRCSTGRMSCLTIKGDTWKVGILQINLMTTLETAVEGRRLRKWLHIRFFWMVALERFLLFFFFFFPGQLLDLDWQLSAKCDFY